MMGVWDSIKLNAEEIYSLEIQKVIIQICEIISVLGKGQRISKHWFHKLIEVYNADDYINDADNRVIAMRYVLNTGLLMENDDYYTWHESVQHSLLLSMFSLGWTTIPDSGEFITITHIFDTDCNVSFPMLDSLILLVECCFRVFSEALDDEISGVNSDLLSLFPHLIMLCSIVRHVHTHIGELTCETSKQVAITRFSFSYSLLNIQMHLHQQQFEKASHVCNVLLEHKVNTKKDFYAIFQLQYYQAVSLFGNREYDPALALFQSLVDHPCDQCDAKWLIRVHSRMAVIYLMKSEEAAALVAYEAALQITKVNHDEESAFSELLVVQLSMEVAKLYAFFERSSEAFELLNEVKTKLSVSNPSGISIEYINVLCCMGHCASKQNKDLDALAYYEEALHISNIIFGTNSTHISQARIYYQIGVTCISMRRYAQALQALETSLSVEKVSICQIYSRRVGSTLTTLGEVLFEQGEHQRARDR
jgi:tetratricopeptide (TPR) repeat protein